MSIVTQKREEVVRALTNSYQFFAERDETFRDKVFQLFEKVYKDEVVIAFCGHFSAGKSTFINHLIGEELLPASPIPTSANLVKLKYGEPAARVFFHDKPAVQYNAPYDIDAIKQMAKDGELIESIELFGNNEKFPKRLVLMDTPGIDSTDDAHRLSTESALHLADYVFYVMDYNHVQSQLNFQFTKELVDQGRQVILIVNMIDKHKDHELSWQQFEQSVEQSFASWNVKYSALFFTSMRDLEHPHNQSRAVEAWLHDTVAKQRYMPTMDALKVLLQQYELQAEGEWESTVAHLETELNGEATAQQLVHFIHERDKLTAFGEQLKAEEDTFMQGMKAILNNAYIMASETRELAHRYLEAQQSSFKVGFLFAGKKTEAEREARFAAFAADLTERIRTQMDYHIEPYLFDQAKQYDIAPPSKALSFVVTNEFLKSAIKQGATLSGDYVLTYTGDVLDGIKRHYLNKAIEQWNEMARKRQADNAALANEVAALTTQLSKWQTLIDRVAAEMKQQTSLDTALMNLLATPHTPAVYDKLAKTIDGQTFIVEQMAERTVQQVARVEEEVEHVSTTEAMTKDALVETMAHIEAQLSEFVKLAPLQQAIAERRERLDDSAFTVALFGAFSAGKSSFANALLGEKLLPVSPNPTTAAINKLCPPTAERPNGTIVVTLKSQQSLLDDVNYSLKLFNLKAFSMEEAFEKVNKVDVKKLQGAEKQHIAFIQAVQRGYGAIKASLNETLIVSFDEWQKYVADEQVACFVELIEVYIDSPLAPYGITLVDTPGADSVNARHTGVAFEYIKNADCILFVTYYNHAFSKADREFLIQLGRVKDSFSLDKMFFLINASDLAENETELKLVREYVEQQLVQYGIRKPRIFSLSSFAALKQKLGEDASYWLNVLKEDHFSSFEAAFYQFFVEELPAVAVTAGRHELQKVIGQLQTWLTDWQQPAAVKQQKVAILATEQQQFDRLIADVNYERNVEKVKQEVETLLFYVKQRTLLRYNEFYRESFNAGTLRDEERDKAAMMHKATRDVLNWMEHDVTQEIRATIVRSDKFFADQFSEWAKEVVAALETALPSLRLTDYDAFSLTPPTVTPLTLVLTEAEQKQIAKGFKSTKQFFALNEAEKVKQWILQAIDSQIERYVAHYKEEFAAFFASVATGRHRQFLQQTTQSAHEQYAVQLQLLTEEHDVTALNAMYSNIHEYMQIRGVY